MEISIVLHSILAEFIPSQLLYHFLFVSLGGLELLMEEPWRGSEDRGTQENSQRRTSINHRSLYLSQLHWQKRSLWEFQEGGLKLRDGHQRVKDCKVKESSRIQYSLEALTGNQNFDESLGEVSTDFVVDARVKDIEDFHVEASPLEMGHNPHGDCDGGIWHLAGFLVDDDLVGKDLDFQLGQVDEVLDDLRQGILTSIEYLINSWANGVWFQGFSTT